LAFDPKTLLKFHNWALEITLTIEKLHVFQKICKKRRINKAKKKKYGSYEGARRIEVVNRQG